MSIRLIAIDIDGTLMPSSGLEISQRNCLALRAAEAAGIEVIIATGRRHTYALPLVAQLGLSEDSVMISSNGAVIRRFDGQLIGRRYLSATSAQRLCGRLRSYETLVFTFDREGAASLVVEDLSRLRARIERWVDANRPWITEICPLESAFEGGDLPIQGMVCGPVEEMKRAEEELLQSGMRGEISTHRTEYPLRDLGILDLLPIGCSKGTAVGRLAQIWGLDPSEVMAIGDNLNDLEMLSYAGRPVVMANAGEELLARAKERGWQVTATNDEDGVGQVVEEVLNQPSSASHSPLRSPPLRTLGAEIGGIEIGGIVRSSEPADGDVFDNGSEDTMVEWAR